MTQREFDSLIQKQANACISVLKMKGKEYARKAAESDSLSDRLEHYRKSAAMRSTTMEDILWGFLTKHLVSLDEMTRAPDEFDIARWTEKITDSINYLLTLSAMVNRHGLQAEE